MIILIFLNSLSLALYDYGDRDSKTENNKKIERANLFFNSIFIAEAGLKIIAHGLIFNRESYLRSGWNIIDAIVVFSGILEISVGSVKLKSLRLLRIFRPLKTINALPGMRKLISALINSIAEFANVVIFLIFVFLMFSTIGLH
jgi:voltage-dependent calcium channel L type alpha-1S